jgi:predicted dehydrogenase
MNEMVMKRPVQLAVLGAGLIGKRHIEHIIAEPEAGLYAIVDPSPAGQPSLPPRA